MKKQGRELRAQERTDFSFSVTSKKKMSRNWSREEKGNNYQVGRAEQ